MFWFFILALILANSRMGRDLAEVIAGRVRGGSSEELRAIEEDALDRLAEIEDRIERAERLLQQGPG